MYVHVHLCAIQSAVCYIYVILYAVGRDLFPLQDSSVTFGPGATFQSVFIQSVFIRPRLDEIFEDTESFTVQLAVAFPPTVFVNEARSQATVNIIDLDSESYTPHVYTLYNSCSCICCNLYTVEPPIKGTLNKGRNTNNLHIKDTFRCTNDELA